MIYPRTHKHTTICELTGIVMMMDQYFSVTDLTVTSCQQNVHSYIAVLYFTLYHGCHYLLNCAVRVNER